MAGGAKWCEGKQSWIRKPEIESGVVSDRGENMRKGKVSRGQGSGAEPVGVTGSVLDAGDPPKLPVRMGFPSVQVGSHGGERELWRPVW